MSAQSTATLVLISAATGFIGLGIGYKIAEKRLTAEFEERMERETNAIRRMYKPEDDTPEDMVERLYGENIVTIIDEYAGKEELLDKVVGPEPTVLVDVRPARTPVAYEKIRPSTVEATAKEEETVTKRRVFEANDDRGEIYVISASEHEANEPGYENVTWSYYAADGVVTDIHEDRIEDFDKFIGTECLGKFGEVSGDANVVHVRNEIIMVDYEIVRSAGSYRQEVLGEEAPPDRPSQRMSRGG